MPPNVAGIWVEGGGKVTGHGNIIRASSDIPGATVRGLVAIDGGMISSNNDDIAAMVLAHLPDAPSRCTSGSMSDSGALRYFSEMSSEVAGVWVEGVESSFKGHSSKIRASSNVAGATVRGAVVTEGGTILGHNNDIAATVSGISSQTGWIADHIVGIGHVIKNFVAYHPYTSLGVLCGSTYVAYQYFSKPVAGGKERARTGFKTRAQVISGRGTDTFSSI